MPAAADEWRSNQEFAKSKGWIKSYLITITDRLASGPEGEKRQDKYMEWRKKTIAQMQKESGDRAEFRELGSNTLLQELKFR